MIINFIKKITPVIILTLFFSCEKEITLELNHSDESLCLNCVMEAGNDSVIFYVTKTQFIEDTEEIETIKNADIELTKDGQLLTGIVYKGNGRYLLKHSPEEGSEYEIKVKLDGYKPLFAKTKVPLKPVADVSFKRDTIYDDSWAKGYYTKARLFVQLQDLPAKDYYWFIRAFIRSIGEKQYGSYGIAYQTDRLLFDEFNRYYNQNYSFPFTNYDYIGALRLDDENILNEDLYNLAFKKHNDSIGTYHYWKDNVWNMLDQFIVSGNLLSPESALNVEDKEMLINDNIEFLYKNEDGTMVPSKTYGKYYYGGYSDHLSIYIYLKRN